MLFALIDLEQLSSHCVVVDRTRQCRFESADVRSTFYRIDIVYKT